jgi:hypothetical protein
MNGILISSSLLHFLNSSISERSESMKQFSIFIHSRFVQYREIARIPSSPTEHPVISRDKRRVFVSFAIAMMLSCI